MIPTGLADVSPRAVVPHANVEIMAGLRYFIVENLRTARRWIRRCLPEFSFEGVTFYELNRHTDPSEVAAMLDPLRSGHDMGVMSEAGCPGVADPGADVVAIAQAEGRKVVPLVGPSSILLALMASGFNGQSFAFNGYLPIDEGERLKAVKRLERESAEKGRTQIFIETPYRNNQLISFLAQHLLPDTRICVASELTDPEKETVKVMKASVWRKMEYDYGKHPTIFLFHAEGARFHAEGAKHPYKERRGRR